jgi:hypothetical protein
MSTFPSIQPSIITQLPFGSTRRFRVASKVMEPGQHYAYYYDANPVASWLLTFETITTAELATLRTFWEGRGAWDSFSFTDPDTGTTYTNCRFDGSTFEVGYLAPGQYSLKLAIQEFR